jgi:hypothetical protein
MAASAHALFDNPFLKMTCHALRLRSSFAQDYFRGTAGAGIARA